MKDDLRHWLVGALIVVVAFLDPLTVLAQGRNGGGRPPVAQGPEDPIAAAITDDIVATVKDAKQRGPRPDHMRRHANNLRTLAKHYRGQELEARITAWAKSQNPDVIELQVPDQKTLDTLIASRKQRGLPTDDIAGLVNASPEQKRAAFLALRQNSLSTQLDKAATLLEQIALEGSANAMAGGFHPSLVQNLPHAQAMALCNAVAGAAGFWILSGVIASFFGPFGLIVGLIFDLIGILFMSYWVVQCPGPDAPKAVPRG